MNAIVPLISSGTPCPFTNTLHLPRLYVKNAADKKGRLSPNYPAFGKGYDQMVAAALGLSKEVVIGAVEGRSYPKFVEELRRLGANFDAGNIAKLNRAILVYIHDDVTRGNILCVEGLTDATGIRDAVTLNMLDDLRELYSQLNPAPAKKKEESDPSATAPVEAPAAEATPATP